LSGVIFVALLSTVLDEFDHLLSFLEMSLLSINSATSEICSEKFSR